MPKSLTAIAVLAALALLGASAVMNFMFASSLGRTQTEGLVLGVVSVSVDVLKAVLAVALGHAARDHRWGFFAVGCFAFALFTALSLAAAFGFSASNRSAVTGEREHQNVKLAGIEAKIGELRGRLKGLPAYRALAIVEETLAVTKNDPRWSSSKQCTSALPAAREFCRGVGELRTERAAALEGKRLEELLAIQEAESERKRSQGSGQASDPQAIALARALGLDEPQIQRGLMALLAVVMEIGAGLGIWLALGVPAVKRREHEPKAEPAPKSVEETAQPVRTESAPPAAPMPQPAEEPRPGIAVSVRAPSAKPARRNGVKAGS